MPNSRNCKEQLNCQTCETRGQSVFCSLSEAGLSSLENAKTSNQYRAKQVIFYEGNQPFGIYCINRGTVKVYKSDADGHQDIVRIGGPGDILGYRCLLAGQPYTATAETLADAEICFIDKASFYEVMQRNHDTTLRIMGRLAQDVRNAEEHVSRLTHNSVRERLSEMLLIYREKFGTQTPEGVALNLNLTRAEWAELVGTTQETLIRVMSQLKKDKLISMQGRNIVLQDIDGLTDAANLID